MSLIVAPPPNGSAWFWWWCWWIGSVTLTPSRRSPETNVIVNDSYRLVVVGYNLQKLQNNVNNVKSEIQIYLFFITRDVKKVFCAGTPKKYIHGTHACKAALFLCLIIHRGQKTALIFFLDLTIHLLSAEHKTPLLTLILIHFLRKHWTSLFEWIHQTTSVKSFALFLFKRNALRCVPVPYFSSFLPRILKLQISGWAVGERGCKIQAFRKVGNLLFSEFFVSANFWKLSETGSGPIY